MSRNPESDELERALGAADPVPADRWNRILSGLAERAEAEGLIDVAYEMHDSPFGELLIGATSAGLVRVGLAVQSQEEILRDLAERVSPRVLKASRPDISSARRQLDEYFAGDRHRFDLNLDWRLSSGFRREVLEATGHIPYGQTRTYRAVATEAGSPNAVRAAGTALATNPLPIVVPCHRVLRTDGQVGAYLGGTSMKESLLALEGGAG
ncbi:MAG TPA: methylated-DNA--[protein]-cysteine S-methyltransferase [Solirubrobacterales bacterium]|nr:methylated-DNA--[protein]-cysteine S-methyltransferase [Solirubrobacterales bacterium]